MANMVASYALDSLWLRSLRGHLRRQVTTGQQFECQNSPKLYLADVCRLSKKNPLIAAILLKLTDFGWL